MPGPRPAVQCVAVIGAGPAGRSIALRLVEAGLDVVLEDVMPEKLRRAQDEYVALAQAASAPAEPNGQTERIEQSSQRSGTLRLALTVEDAVHDADLAIDFVPDELESKLEIFSMLDRMCPPRTILCTPTQTLSLTDLASCTYRPGLCVGISGDLDPLRPTPVSILRSRFAEQRALDAVQDLLGRIGIAADIGPDREEPMLVKNQIC